MLLSAAAKARSVPVSADRAQRGHERPIPGRSLEPTRPAEAQPAVGRRRGADAHEGKLGPAAPAAPLSVWEAIGRAATGHRGPPLVLRLGVRGERVAGLTRLLGATMLARAVREADLLGIVPQRIILARCAIPVCGHAASVCASSR